MTIRYLLMTQGIYTTLTGAWPLVHMNSFLFVTGPKVDLWLVKTVSILFVCTGLSLMFPFSSKSGNRPVSSIFLGMSLSLALLVIDIYYSANKVISPVYLLDALIELIFFSFWIFVVVRYFVKGRTELVNFKI